MIVISDQEYEVINVLEEIDRFDEGGEIIGEHWFMELHKVGDKSFHPTHIAKRYFDNLEKIHFFEINYSKAPDLGKLKVGETLKWKSGDDWKDKKIILVKDIQVR